MIDVWIFNSFILINDDFNDFQLASLRQTVKRRFLKTFTFQSIMLVTCTSKKIL